MSNTLNSSLKRMRHYKDTYPFAYWLTVYINDWSLLSSGLSTYSPRIVRLCSEILRFQKVVFLNLQLEGLILELIIKRYGYKCVGVNRVESKQCECGSMWECGNVSIQGENVWECVCN